MSRALKLGLVLAAALFSFAGPSAAQDYPNRPIKIIVPYAAGGSGDFFSRSIGQYLSEALKQPFVIENRPGAGSIIGSDAVAKSPPDGYTLLLITSNHTTNETLVPNAPFKMMRDFAPVAMLSSTDLAMVAPNSLPANTVPELIALAKAKPGVYTYASSGTGTPYHMAAEQFKWATKTDILHVPYKLASVARTDTISGQVHLMFDGVGTMAQNVNAKQLKALATTGRKRSPLLPNVPTVLESGVNYESVFWLGLVAPAGTPPAIVNRLNAEIAKAAQRADLKESWAKQGAEPNIMTVQEFDKFLRDDIVKWAEIVKVSGATIN